MRKISKLSGTPGIALAEGDLGVAIKSRTLKLIEELPADVLETEIGFSALINLVVRAAQIHDIKAPELCEAIRAGMED